MLIKQWCDDLIYLVNTLKKMKEPYQQTVALVQLDLIVKKAEEMKKQVHK